MSDVGKPVDVGPTMIEGVNELVGDDPAHVGLVSDIILAQNNLGRGSIKSATDISVTVLARKVPPWVNSTT